MEEKEYPECLRVMSQSNEYDYLHGYHSIADVTSYKKADRNSLNRKNVTVQGTRWMFESSFLSGIKK